MRPRIPRFSGMRKVPAVSRPDSRPPAEDYFSRVANALIAQIRNGTAPWTEAWKPGERALPWNLKTGKEYRGCNSVWLASNARSRGFSDERWGTFKQVRDMGGHVRRGENGCPILYWHCQEKRLARDQQGRPVLGDDGEPIYETRSMSSPRVYRYTVFNAEQCSGLPDRQLPAARQDWDAHEGAEKVLRKAGAVVEHSRENRAYYDLGRDRIVLPYKSQFDSGPGYYQTALHELGHWTGHPDRLNRSTLIRGMEYGDLSPEYAREELRAEISSLMTGNRIGLGHDPGRHAAYVESWVKALRSDPREIYRASKDAQEMSDYVLGRDWERVGQRYPVMPGERPGESTARPSGQNRPAVDLSPPRAVGITTPERHVGRGHPTGFGR